MKNKNLPFVSVIILNYNGLDYTIDCLKSLKKIDYSSHEIIVIDNNSKNNEADVIQKKFPNIKVIKAEKNCGFAGGNNLGYKHAKGEYIVLLNNDTLVDKNWLKELVKVFKDPSVAIVQSRMFAKYKKEDYYYDRNNGQSIIGTPILNKEEYDQNGVKDIFIAVGCSLIYPSKLFEEPFDEDYFFNGEDTALAFRAKLNGYKIKEAKNSIVYHEGNVTTNKVSNLNTFLKERNYLMNLLIFYEAKSLFKLTPIMLASIIFKNAYHPTKVHIRFKSYLWLLTNYKKISEKRKRMQKLRKINDSQLFKKMSYKFIDPETTSSNIAKKTSKMINSFSHRYCSLIGIKTQEFYKD